MDIRASRFLLSSVCDHFTTNDVAYSKCSIIEFKRQISTSLYERLLLSDGKPNKERVLELAEKGQEIATPADIVKDPYFFEFLGIPDKKPVMENELEKALVRQIGILREIDNELYKRNKKVYR